MSSNKPTAKKGKAGTLYRTNAPKIGMIKPIIAKRINTKLKQNST